MKNLRKIVVYFGFITSVCGLGSCSDEFEDGSYYTLTDHTVASYIDETPGYDTFRRLMDETDSRGLLSTYGHYTCFLPSDAAFERFFREYSINYDQLSMEDKKELIYNHIIMSSSVDYTTSTFEEGALPTVSMSTQKINISYQSDGSGSSFDIYVNTNARIVEQDIETHNGVIHVVDNVLYYPDEFIDDILREHNVFSLFLEAMTATGVNQLVHNVYDSEYVPEVGPEGFIDPNYTNVTYYVPQDKRVAYTCFAETDDVFAAKGITDLASLQAFAERFYGVEDQGDFTSERNALNKFVRYHILDRQLGANEFFKTNNTVPDYVSEVEEFYPTLLKDRIIEVKNRNGGVINFRNQPGDVSDVPAYVSIDASLRNISAINAYIHALDDILVYDENIMRSDVLNRRIRMDIANLIPEMANNYYRYSYNLGQEYSGGLKVPGDGVYSDYFKCTTATRPYLVYYNDGTYHTVQFYVRGWFDYELKTLPVPPGEWELRIGATMHDYYGIAQVFIDGMIQGIPIDLAAGQKENDLRVGWEKDQNGVINVENDKAMRNRGYMKGPASEFNPNNPEGGTLRDDPSFLRVIVGRFNAAEYGSHIFRSKNIYSDNAYFVIEYLELIPTSLIEDEDIY